MPTRQFVFIMFVLLATTMARAQSNMVLFISPSGDYIGQGQTYYTTNQADIRVFFYGGAPPAILVYAFDYSMMFAGPNGTIPTVGIYSNAVSLPIIGSSPGIAVSGHGRGCRPVCGSFQVFEIHTDGDGNLDRLWITFSHRYPCYAAPLTGEIRYNSSLAPPVPLARILRVPAEFPTIQAALNTVSGLAVDRVVVDPGVYNESVQFGAKPAELTSSEGPTATYILAPTGSVAVTFAGATPESLLCGFTLMDSTVGVSISGGSPTIVSNAIVNCGSGINAGSGDRSSSPRIRYNTITGCSGGAIGLSFCGTPLVEGNHLEDNGGGIAMWEVLAPLIRNNIIRRNRGAGISMVSDCDADIVQNLIVENSGIGIQDSTIYGTRGSWIVNNTIVANGGAGISSGGGGQIVVNNIVVGNPACAFHQSLPPVIHFNNIYSPDGVAYAGITNLTGVDGNISADPFFTCQPGGDFHLLAVSPCVDAGTNGAALMPATDFGGTARILAGHSNGPGIVDLGAFELDGAAPPPVPCLFLYCPANIVAIVAPGQNSAIVSFPLPFATPGATVTNSPPSGSVFPAGTNTVTSSANYGTNVLTSTFTVTVLVPPTIASSPHGAVVLAGIPTNFAVLAQGTLPLRYQWSFEGTSLAAATNSTLAVFSPQTSDEGFYRVIVTNVAGSITSAPALLRVLPTGPSILSGPLSQTIPAGSNATFSVSVAGSAPLGFQWFRGSSSLPGANSSQLVLSNVQSGDVGGYSVTISNLLGSATSGTAELNVLAALPVFVLQPADPTGGLLPVSTNYQLTALARGSEPIFYQWRRSGTNLPGATGTTLAFSNVTAAISGNYSVVAANMMGSVTSRVARISVFGAGVPPAFTQQPVSVEVLEGSTVTLNSLATGSAPLRYQWCFQGTNLPAQTNRQLVLTAITPAAAGPYFVIASNSFGATNSVTAEVAVNQSLVLQQPLSNLVADAGSTVTLAVGASGSGGLSYRWRFNTTLLTNLEAVLVLTNVQPSHSGYYQVTVSNLYGSRSSTGRLSVFGLPSWVVAWGDNSGNQTNVPSTFGDAIAIAGGDYHSLVLRHTGSLVGWGYNGDGQADTPSNSLRYVTIAAGAHHNLAITENGLVVAWGRNTDSQCDVPTSAMTALAVAAGESHSLALLPSGSVVAWGNNAFGQISVPSGLKGVYAIAAGRNHSLALRGNGTVAGWGLDTSGQATPPQSLSGVAAIAAGYLHSVALCSNSTVIAWGDNTYDQATVPSGLSNVVAVAAGDFHTLALLADGIVVAWGNDWLGQTDVPPTVTGATGIASGYYHGLALIPVPRLYPYMIPEGLVIDWSGPGTLQWAPTPAGTYNDIPNFSRPYTNADLSSLSKFYRLRR